MGDRERICRLCRQKCAQNFKNIEGNAKEAVEILLPKINLAVSEAPVMCTICAKTLEKCFDFKWTCLSRNRSILSCVNRKDSVKRNLKYLREIKEENDNTNGIQGPTACGLCAKPSNSCSIVSLDVDEEKIMLEECFPELDLSITKICVPCHESLVNCFHFITKCSITDEKIQKYSRKSSINNDDVRELNRPPRVSIQLEQIFCDEGANFSEDVTRRDEIFVKTVDQIYHDVEQFKSEDLLSCLEEDNTAGTTKEEGELLEEINVEQTCDNFVKKEDQDFYNEIQFTVRDLFVFDKESNKLDVIKVKEEFFEEENKVEYESENCIEMEEQESKNLQFIVKVPSMEVDLNQIELIKLEETFHEDEEAANGKIEMKCDNYLETENKKFYSLSHFTSNNVLTCEEDLYCTKFYNPKTEEISSERGENDTENENKYLATIDEEQKYNLNEEVDTKTDLQNSSRFEDNLILSEHEVDPTKQCINLMSVNKTVSVIKNRKRAIVHKDPSEAIYQCDSCSFQTKRKISIEVHVLIHKDPSEVTMYSCDDCSFQTISKSYLTKHMLKHKYPSEVTMYKCGSCLYQTKRRYCLIRHMLVHKDPSDVTMYNCDFCSFQTKHKSYLTKHMLTHKDPSEVTMYNCDVCSFQTKHKSCLTKHILTHKDPSEVTMYKCDICSFQTKHKSYLKEHLLTHKDPSEVTMYNCNICTFQTKSKKNFRCHLLGHKDPSDITMFNCNFCSFQTKRKRNLQLHMLIHKDPSDVIMHNCDICSFQTKRRHNLISHLLIHKNPSDVTMYKCDFCSFQTKHKRHVKRHLLTHKVSLEV